jgi:methionyl-tRNA formyltransferase
MRIVFFGTPDFAAFSLRKIVENGFEVVAVITSPDKPAGRGQKLHESAVKITAVQLGIPIMQPTNLKSIEFISQFEQINADLAVVIAFRMLPERVWSAPKLGSMNLHASLLPNYRGAAPIQHAIINGELETGVTTFFLKHEIDTGDIIERETVEIESTDNASVLHDKLMIIGADVVIKSLKRIELEGENIELIPQTIPVETNEIIKINTAPKLSREFCELSLFKSVISVYNKIRGLSNYPGAWLISPWGEMKILESQPCILNPTGFSHQEIHEFSRDENWIQRLKSDLQAADSNQNEWGSNLKPFIILANSIFLCCEDGNLLEIKRLKLSGKSEMDGKSFVNGLKSKKIS